MKLRKGRMVVHLGGRAGAASRNRGKLMRLEEELGRVEGFTGHRWRVSRNDIHVYGYAARCIDHVNADYLLLVR